MSRTTVINHFKWYYENGYITAKDGNAAYRFEDGAIHGIVVTVSGANKHKMEDSDFIALTTDGKSVILKNGLYIPVGLTTRKPSIETGAHITALKATGMNTSVHVHSPNTVALAALFETNDVYKPNGVALTQVLNTKWPELFRYTKVGNIVPFLEPGSNELHEAIVDGIHDGYDEHKAFYVGEGSNIVIMQRHGVLAVGETLDECMEHIVRLEHISTILLKIITASNGRLESIL
jgi:ribulose-5-phosphate 4-epimerase/fuculose-1-phosphate aldolase